MPTPHCALQTSSTAITTPAAAAAAEGGGSVMSDELALQALIGTLQRRMTEAVGAVGGAAMDNQVRESYVENTLRNAQTLARTRASG